MQKLREIGKFMVYGKHHVLCQEQTPIEKIILIKSGWVRRVAAFRLIPLRPASRLAWVKRSAWIFWARETVSALKARTKTETWKYSASVMARTEVLEIPLAPFADDPALRERIVAAFAAFSNADDSLAAQSKRLPICARWLQPKRK